MYISNRNNRGLINGKAPKTTALCYFSDMLSLSQSGGEGASYPQTLTLPHLRCFMITPLNGNRKQNTNNVYHLTFFAEKSIWNENNCDPANFFCYYWIQVFSSENFWITQQISLQNQKRSRHWMFNVTNCHTMGLFYLQSFFC